MPVFDLSNCYRADQIALRFGLGAHQWRGAEGMETHGPWASVRIQMTQW